MWDTVPSTPRLTVAYISTFVLFLHSQYHMLALGLVLRGLGMTSSEPSGATCFFNDSHEFRQFGPHSTKLYLLKHDKSIWNWSDHKDSSYSSEKIQISGFDYQRRSFQNRNNFKTSTYNGICRKTRVRFGKTRASVGNQRLDCCTHLLSQSFGMPANSKH